MILESIQDVIGVAKHFHDQQTRRSGEPAINHPQRVAQILIKFYGEEDQSVEIIENLIQAGWLHDTIEDHISKAEKRARQEAEARGMTQVDTEDFVQRVADNAESEVIHHISDATENPAVLRLVRELTHIKDPDLPKIEDYVRYIKSLSSLALKVKLADMLDNLQSSPSTRQVLKYEAALRALEKKPKEINNLHWRALLNTVRDQKISLGVSLKSESLIRKFVRIILLEELQK